MIMTTAWIMAVVSGSAGIAAASGAA